LRLPGQPLDTVTRAFTEHRFGHDFSRVRIHSDTRAGQSALDIKAAAYTVGDDVVFAPGRYAPGTVPGTRLLAHELAHVVQQSGGWNGDSFLSMAKPGSVAEQRASTAADQVLDGRPARIRGGHPRRLARRLLVDEFNEATPGEPAGQNVPTRAVTIEGYLRRLSRQGDVRVDQSSGEVRMNREFCRERSWYERLGLGLMSGMSRGAEIGVYFGGVGALPGAIIGGLIGAFGGLFGLSHQSRAAESATPTGSTCICDMIRSPNTWTIEIDPEGGGRTGTGVVQVPAPNAPRIWGAATISGQLQELEPWLILGHELCGHAWLEDRNEEEDVDLDRELRHHRTVERENQIRAEHGIAPRGHELRDPYCGESFFRERNDPQRQRQWQRRVPEDQRALVRSIGEPFTYLEECQLERVRVFGERARRIPVSQRIE
jgi:hypothetical protein